MRELSNQLSIVLDVVIVLNTIEVWHLKIVADGLVMRGRRQEAVSRRNETKLYEARAAPEGYITRGGTSEWS